MNKKARKTGSTKKYGYEGLQEDIRALKFPKIETWTNKYPGREYEIVITTSEFTSLCPKTNLPDFGTITIRYVPNKKCIELKSFKEYLIAYRNIGIFYEHTTNKILEDVVKACKPRRAEIEGRFNLRGGIGTTVIAKYEEKKGYIS